MNAVAKQVGRNIAEARRAAGLSQTELSERIAICHQDISRMECGRNCPRVPTLLRVARGLEVPLPDLVRGIE
jgi:ribosome-binding protein aMBF1 (putative translation factor)